MGVAQVNEAYFEDASFISAPGEVQPGYTVPSNGGRPSSGPKPPPTLTVGRGANLPLWTDYLGPDP